MNKDTRWLFTDTERWTAEGLITAEQAACIRSLYPAPTPTLPWGLLVFSCAGAAVVGLGVILLIAYNWEDVPKFGKLTLVFGAIIATHIAGLALQRRPGWQPRLGEALSLLGSMLFGAGIWLVAQIYNIDEHFPNGFLLWALGSLAMAWALESIPQAILATVAFAFWGSYETWEFASPTLWAIIAVLLGVGPLAWRKQSALLTAVVLAAVYFLSIITLSSWGGGAHALTATLALSALLIAAEKLARTPLGEPLAGAAVGRFFGLGGFLVCVFLLGFHDESRHLLDWGDRPGRAPVVAVAYGWIVFALAAAGWGLVTWRTLRQKRLTVPLEEWLCPIALVYAYLLAALGNADEVFIAVTFNLIFLGIAVMWMLRGCREAQLRSTVVGSLLFGTLVLARYFDLFESLATRGLTFIVLGGILIAEAMYYRKMRREDAAEGDRP